MRKIESLPPLFTQTQPATVLTYDLKLLTPMIGGGVKSWQRDPNQPIRASAIKAQLRFWWRTMQDFATKEELLAAEGEIFGNTDKGSRVRIQVLHAKTPEQVIGVIEWLHNGNNIRRRHFANLPKYVTFPFEQVNQNIPANEDVYRITGIDGTFNLTIQCPADLESVIKNCVRLWILFGGVGARTRRGAGSLKCLMENGNTVNNWFENGQDLAQWLAGLVHDQPDPAASSSPYPRLKKGTLAYRPINKQNATTAWSQFLGLDTGGDPGYGNFRQGQGLGRNAGIPRPGRSFWPEADSIREITGVYNPAHTPAHLARNWFPRAAFGLPIQFKFCTMGDPGCPAQPRDAEKFNLFPMEIVDGRDVIYERWPSPCLLKIVALSNDKLLEVCLFLNAKRPGLKLKGPGVDYTVPALELPANFATKNMGLPAPLDKFEEPTSGLIRRLNLTNKTQL